MAKRIGAHRSGGSHGTCSTRNRTTRVPGCVGRLTTPPVPKGSAAPAEASYVPMFIHLALVFGAGVYLPPPLVGWFQHIALLLG